MSEYEKRFQLFKNNILCIGKCMELYYCNAVFILFYHLDSIQVKTLEKLKNVNLV